MTTFRNIDCVTNYTIYPIYSIFSSLRTSMKIIKYRIKASIIVPLPLLLLFSRYFHVIKAGVNLWHKIFIKWTAPASQVLIEFTRHMLRENFAAPKRRREGGGEKRERGESTHTDTHTFHIHSTYSTHTPHTFHTHSTHSTHIPHTHSTHTTHIPHILHIHSTHTPHT